MVCVLCSHWGYPGCSTLLGLPGKPGSSPQCPRDTCWGHLPLAEWHIWVHKRKGQEAALSWPAGGPGAPVPGAAHWAGQLRKSHIPTGRLRFCQWIISLSPKKAKSTLGVLQSNINVVFGLWCSSARLPITRGSIVQRIPCWLIGKNIYTAKQHTVSYFNAMCYHSILIRNTHLLF